MKRMSLAFLVGLGLALLTGCSSGHSNPAQSAATPPDQVTGIDTPKSVSVVTAN